jgi:hypothetical protein
VLLPLPELTQLHKYYGFVQKRKLLFDLTDAGVGVRPIPRKYIEARSSWWRRWFGFE